ncbi:MAG: hypothetical protein JWO67_1520 [Streptosporangiaceae bacterium]|nr:hypothetical protein [Streptosporangiaceae bacterium]
MTSPTNPDRPTAAEVAALTARLRSISERGRDVSAAERAAFLADKDALVARITDTDAHAEVADSERAQRLQERPWTAQGHTVDRATWVVTPEDPHEQAEVTAQREQIPGRDPDWSATQRVDDGPAIAVPWFTEMEAEQDQRREQLTRWHTDDAIQDADINHDGRTLDEGLYVTDDGPGLP